MKSALLAVLLATGCNLYFGPSGNNGGGGGGPGGGISPTVDAGPGYIPDAAVVDAEAEFFNNVYPLIQSNCLSCHVGPAPNLFPAPDPVSVYDAIVDNYQLNGCFDPDEARLTQKWIHEGNSWTQLQFDVIGQWLFDQGTVTLGGGVSSLPNCGGPPPGTAPADVVRAEFANCVPAIGPAALHSTGADAIWNLKSSAGTCVSCHGASAANGFSLGSNDAGLMASLAVAPNDLFDLQQDSAGGMLTVFDQLGLTALGTQLANGTGTHPSFTLTPALETAFGNYITLVNDVEDTPGCVPIVMGTAPYQFE